jgi:hypothetical protein
MLAKLFAKRQLVFEWKIEASNVGGRMGMSMQAKDLC